MGGGDGIGDTDGVLPLVRLLQAGFLSALAALAPAGAQSEPVQPVELWLARWWNIANGLPQSTINDLLQTENGELWIATFGGLLRFDGVSFRSFDLNTLPELDSIRVTSLEADPRGGVWFATQSGSISRLVNGRIVESARLSGSREILALLRGQDGALWVQTSTGSVHRYADGAWKDVLAGGRGGRYQGLALASGGAIAVAYGKELVLFDAKGEERARYESPARVHAVASAKDGGLWVGLEDGPARLVQGEIRRYTTNPPIKMPVAAVREDDDGHVWIGTPAGSVCIAIDSIFGSRMIVSSAERITSGFDVRTLLVDREGNLWTGSTNSGLMRLRPNRIDTPGMERGELPVYGLCDDGDGGAWLALGPRGLGHVESGGRTVQFERLEPPAKEGVHSLLTDANGRVWVGAGQVWYRREPGPGESFAPVLEGQTFPSRVGPALALEDGDVWLSSNLGRLVRVEPDDRIVEEVALQMTPSVLARAGDGGLWIGSEHGIVHRSAKGELTHFGAEEGVPRGTVRDLLPDADGALWIATYGGGLARLANGRVRRISRAEGLLDSSLTRVLEDDRGRFWLLSNLGMIVADRAELLDVLEGRRARIDPVVIGPEGGMNEASFGLPAGFRSATGELWFGTIQSAMRIDASQFPFDRVAPASSIERVRADETELALADDLEVPAGTRRVEFEFTAFTLTAPERARFRYQLVNYDEGWIDGGDQRRAAYTGLWPGRYVFRVLARNEDGVWGERPAGLAFVVLPSWWQTPLFGALALLAFAAALLGVHRLRVSALARKASVQLELARARADAEQRESRLREELAHVARVATAGELATSLAHEVNQPLAAIATNAQAGRRFLARGAAEREELDEILRDIAQEAQRASEVIRRLREFLRKHASERRELDLAQVVGDTLPLVRRELADGNVELVREFPADLPHVEADPVQLQQVLVNLVKNACEAMAGRSGPRRIELGSRRIDGRVELSVRDTGPGLAPEVAGRLFEPFVTTKATGMGLGLAICRSIVEAHGGRLSAEPAAGGGTVFRVELPLRNHEDAHS